MLVRDILHSTEVTISFEFFPPKTEHGWETLFQKIEALRPISPSWVSVTYGAGGSSGENTQRLVVRIKRETGITVVSHITSVGMGQSAIAGILQTCSDNGIENFLAIRGDPPPGVVCRTPPDGFRYASELVRFIKREYPSSCVGVAGFPEGHPDTPNRLMEMDHLKAKVDEGADYIITQLFFDNRDFFDFRERCELAGIKVPVIPGIMPVLSRNGMQKIAGVAAGARIPAEIIRKVGSSADDCAVERFGLSWASGQVMDLLDRGVKGVHFYTLNTARIPLEICRRIGLADSAHVSDCIDQIRAIHGATHR